MSVEAAIENGDFQQALASLEHETNGPTADPGRLLMRFNMEVRLQRFQAAQATMQRLVAAAPEVAGPMGAFAAAAQAEELATLRRRDPAHAGKGSAIGLPPAHQLALMKASVCHTHGDAQAAKAALSEAAALTPATSGTITRVGGATQRFTAIADSDELTGATLPVYDGAKLLDLAFSELSSITFLDPKTSFDVMWSQADIEMVDGTRLRGRIPSFYAGTGVADDGSVRAGRETIWRHDRGYAEALGQRDWSVTTADGGRSMVGILGVQRIDFDNPRRAQGHAGQGGRAGHAGAPAAWGAPWGQAQAFPQAGASAAKVPGWGIPVAVVAAFAGLSAFLYLGMLGGRAAAEGVFGLLGIAVIAAVGAAVAGAQTLARKRTGLAVATFAIAGFGVLVGIGGVAMDAAHRKSQYTPSSNTYEPPPRRATSVDSYAALCDGKEAFPGAKKYEKSASAGAPSKVAVFRKYLDDKTPMYKRDERAKSFEGVVAGDNDVDDVQLVACMELKRKGEPLFCNYYGAQVEVYDMTHTLRILEAKTGKVVKEDTFELDRRTEKCAGSVTGNSYKGADYVPKLISTLLPLQPDGVALPKAERIDLDAVCSGSPIPQAAPYKPGAGKRAAHLVYFAQATQSSTREDLPDGLSTTDPVEEDVTKYELVACVTGKPLKKKADCDFTSGKVLEIHDGEIEVAMYEAATAKLVEKKTFKATSGACPYSHKFFGNRDKRMLTVEPAFQAYWATMTGAPPPKPKPAAGGQGAWSLDDRLD